MSQSPLYIPIPYMSNAIPMGFWIKVVIRTILTITAIIVTHSYLYIFDKLQTNNPRLRKIESTRKARGRKTTKTITRKLAYTTSIGGCRVESMKILVDIVLLWISSSLIFHSAITYFHIHVRYYNMKT